MDNKTYDTLKAYCLKRGINSAKFQSYRGAWYVNGRLVIPPKPIVNMSTQWGSEENVTVIEGQYTCTRNRI